jgi:hypothetical protein
MSLLRLDLLALAADLVILVLAIWFRRERKLFSE